MSVKVGRPLTVIHEPVHDYDDTLARRVNRVFETLRPERPLVRVNWLVHPTAELFLPLGHGEKTEPDDAAIGPLYLRTERQTLVRLPRTGAVVFGIKTSITPVSCLTPEQAEALYHALAELDDETMQYRARSRALEAALERLAPAKTS